MRKFIALIIISVLLAAAFLSAGFALASDITNAAYSGVVEVSNNGTAASEVSVNCSIDTQSLIDDWGVDDNLTYTAVRNATGADMPYMPGVGSNPWCFWVPSINAESYLNYVLYLGTSNLSATRYYFPGSTGMNTSDNVDLEPGDNFTIELSGYIDTSQVDENLVCKSGSMSIHISGSSNITASFYSANSTDTETIRPNAPGAAAPFNNYGDSPNWKCVDEASADDDTTYIYNTSQTYSTGYYNLGSASPPDHSVISSVDVYFRIKPNVTEGTAYATPILRLNSVNSEGTEEIRDPDTYLTYSQTISRPGGGNWSHSDIESLQVGLKLRINNASYQARCTQIYAVVHYDTYSESLSVTAGDIESGEHKIAVYADTDNLTIEIDDVIKDSVALSGASAPDNNNDWTDCNVAATPYVEYIKKHVNGVLQQHIVWENDTAFHDLSGNDHDATPTFRTTSSDSDVTAELVSFEAINLATAPAYSVTGGEPFITENISQSGNFTTAVNPTGFPGAAVIEEVSSSSGIPSQIPFTIIFTLTGLIMGLGAVYAMARAGQKSSIVIIAAEIIVMGVGIALRVIDFWMLGLFLIIAIALAMGSRHITWGMPSGGNLIGMLATDFIGLTLINRWIEGAMMQAAETDFINTLMFTKVFSLFGIPVPIINVEFFTTGIPRMLKWDYSFFGGNAQILQYFLYSITAVVSFMLFCVIIGLLANYFTRVR